MTEASFFNFFLSVGAAYSVSYTLFAPFERLKIVLQTHRLSVSNQDILKKPIQAFKRIQIITLALLKIL